MLSLKNSFVFLHQICQSKAWHQHCTTHKIRFRLFTDSRKRKLEYREKVFGEFQVLPCFSRKMILYWSTKFGIVTPWTNNPWPRKFDWDFWQTSKQIYRKLQYKEKAFQVFHGLSGFPRKIDLYSSSKFRILKPWTNIQSLKIFE